MAVKWYKAVCGHRTLWPDKEFCMTCEDAETLRKIRARSRQENERVRNNWASATRREEKEFRG